MSCIVFEYDGLDEAIFHSLNKLYVYENDVEYILSTNSRVFPLEDLNPNLKNDGPPDECVPHISNFIVVYLSTAMGKVDMSTLSHLHSE